jgi:t-SNARE complex subunit (syntaxin)
MTNDMIINLVSEQNEESEEEEDEVCTEVVKKKKSRAEGLNAIERALRYVEQRRTPHLPIFCC